MALLRTRTRDVDRDAESRIPGFLKVATQPTTTTVPWVVQGDPTDLANQQLTGLIAAGNTASGRIDPYEVTGLPAFQMPTDAESWAKLGYTGQVLADPSGLVDSDGYSDMSLSSDLQQFIADNSLKPAVSRVGNSGEIGVANSAGEVTPTTQWNMGDDAFWNSALAAAALVGGAVGSNPAFGGGATESALGNVAVDAAEFGVPVSSGGTGMLGSGPAAIGAGDGGMLSTVPLETAPVLPTVPSGGIGTLGAGPAAISAGQGEMLASTPLETAPVLPEVATTPTLPISGLPSSSNDTTAPVQTTPLDDFTKWAKANPEIAKLLFAGGGAALSGSGGSGGGGYVDSGYRPTINRGGFMSQTAAPQTSQPQSVAGLISMSGQPGVQNSGLWRYGLLGGK